MEPSHDLLPRPARVALYIIWLIMAAATPFVVIMAGEEFGQAMVVSASVIGGAAGVVAISHPTKNNEQSYYQGYEQGYNEAYYEDVSSS